MAYSSNLSPGFTPGNNICFVIIRTSQFIQELLVVGLTWWYSYQSYRISKGISLGKTVSSLLLYNGSIYFLFLAALYIFDVFSQTASVSDTVVVVNNFATMFFDPITSIILCRFMLSLNELHASISSMTRSGIDSRQVRQLATSAVLQFAAQPTDSLPSFLASFSYPVHIESVMHDTESDGLSDDESEEQELEGCGGADPVI
ncbi:hypothetical protein GSI_07753 [Ganoderma sinense ZZ0214-1]|uniref:Uncharacterized protein n=1 Tax=Ganoderma sinense ZZ0214-1 TaxID=1077348 RepID=A0A2G8S8U1_9APHY|nr:hypothetical protein GSI_07682 [Ganoderma sinense ZZ0214-1]PIL30175.1 hypothetical protein GSI_07753 [Ganoderma sinense ZZ0214-1]